MGLSLWGVLMLAMDTATGVVSAALHDGSRVLAQQDVARPQAHAEELAPAVADLLARAARTPEQITHVVVGIGPGPFTGLRVGVVTAATFAHAIGARVGGVCSLDAIAHQVWLAGLADNRLLVAADARRKEVYWADYRLDERGAHREAGPDVGKAADLPGELRERPVAGRGPLLYPEAFGGSADTPAPLALPVLDVSAGVLAHLAVTRLARGEELEPLQPLYLRRPDAQPQSERKSVTSGAGTRAAGP